ncbi:MAG: hypothetical protein MUF23_13205, partial [Pirellula sp.]|nr:hypothetical protein [Pirellula sp.]
MIHRIPPISFSTAIVLMACTIFAWCPNRSDAQEGALPLPTGAEQITDARVTSTIAFLASDELAGRGTGTAEFDIAAAYVAARFRGAGLEGGGVDGSFYHESKSTVSRVPEHATLEDAVGAPIAHWGLLSANDEPWEME